MSEQGIVVLKAKEETRDQEKERILKEMTLDFGGRYVEICTCLNKLVGKVLDLEDEVIALKSKKEEPANTENKPKLGRPSNKTAQENVQ